MYGQDSYYQNPYYKKIVAPTVDEQVLDIKTGQQWLEQYGSMTPPRSLWNKMWYEGEVSCLFADSNLGKSILAVQIAQDIAENEPVIYFDFELSGKQFQIRYTSYDGSDYYTFPANFMRAELKVDEYDNYFEDTVIEAIEEAAKRRKAKVLIIDNITWLCAQSEHGDSAGILMQKLVALKKAHGWSILVIAHTPKRNLGAPITQNDLAGSKRLFNFFDSVFAIGSSIKDGNARYIKQIKSRNGAIVHGEDAVMSCTIEKDYNFLCFHIGEDAPEVEHLPDGDEKRRVLAQETQKLRGEGLTQREIAEKLGISVASVNRYLK